MKKGCEKMKKRIFLVIMMLLLAVNCLALPTCAVQEDAAGTDGLLLVVMPEEGADTWGFLFVSTDPVDGKLMCTQIPADQPVSIRAYENHVLSAGMTLGDVCALGYAWEEDAGAIGISAASVQTSFRVSPAYTLLLSAEDADCIFRQALSVLHISQISPDAAVAFERVLVGIQGLDAEAQRDLAAFVLTHCVSDADEDAVSAYLTGMIGNSGGCEMRTFQPA